MFERKQHSNCYNKIEKIDILNVRVDVLTKERLIKEVFNHIENNQRGWVSYVNIHTINLAHQHPWYNDFINKSLIVYCDGQGVRFAASVLGQFLPERITLTDFLHELVQLSAQREYKLYFLGAEKEVLENAMNVLKRIVPSAQITGYHHGYLTEELNDFVIQDINTKQPDILFVGITPPKQERWVLDNFDRLKAKIIWVGGGFIDVLSGKTKRCPPLLASIGFEWLFRLIQEPSRLWRRYVFGIPDFFIKIVKSKKKKRNTDTIDKE